VKSQEFIIKDGPCGAETIFKIIGLRWKPKILETCYIRNRASLSMLKEIMPDCSTTVLSRQLSSLIKDGMLVCGENEDYTLTKQGREVLPIMAMMLQLTYLCDYPSSGYDNAVEYAKNLIGEKWKTRILWVIHTYKKARFNELQKAIDGISHKVLNEQLVDMWKEGLIVKNEYLEQPPRTEYALTETGEMAFNITQALAEWGREYGFIKVKVTIHPN